MSTFSIGIQLANDIPFTGYSIKNGQIVDGKGNVSNFPTYQAATVQVNANRTGTFLIQSMVEQQKSERTGLHYLESMWVTKWLSLQQQ